MIIGLSLGIGFGVYQTHDGKNLQSFAAAHNELRKEIKTANAAVQAANEEARADRKRFVDCKGYILAQSEEPR